MLEQMLFVHSVLRGIVWRVTRFMGGRTRADELTDGTGLPRRGRVGEHGGGGDGRPGVSTRNGRTERDLANYGK